jgi:hypothetical protein
VCTGMQYSKTEQQQSNDKISVSASNDQRAILPLCRCGNAVCVNRNGVLYSDGTMHEQSQRILQIQAVRCCDAHSTMAAAPQAVFAVCSRVYSSNSTVLRS